MARVFQLVGFETLLEASSVIPTWEPVAQAYARFGATIELNGPLGRAGSLPYSYIAKYEWPEDVYRARFGERVPSDAGSDPMRIVQLGFYTGDPQLLDAPKAIAFFDRPEQVEALIAEWQAKKPKVRAAALYRAIQARYSVAVEVTSLLGGDDVSELFAPAQPRAVGVFRKLR